MGWYETATVDQTSSTAQVARMAGVTEAHVRRLCIEGTLDAVKVGGRWLVHDASVRRWLRSRRKPGPKPKGSRPVRGEQLDLDIDNE